MHVKHVIVYCSVHFKRDINRAAEVVSNSITDILNERMRQLYHCQSREDYYLLLDLLEDNE